MDHMRWLQLVEQFSGRLGIAVAAIISRKPRATRETIPSSPEIYVLARQKDPLFIRFPAEWRADGFVLDYPFNRRTNQATSCKEKVVSIDVQVFLTSRSLPPVTRTTADRRETRSEYL